MTFLLRPKGKVTQPFKSGDQGLHVGIDFYYGYKKPRWALHDGYIYKTRGKDNPDPMEYRTVFQIADTPIGTLEIVYEHCWDIWVGEGNKVAQGQPIYTEGNTGTAVFAGGRRVSREDKYKGLGSHVHIHVRPVKRVKEINSREHYLRNLDGSEYQDENGNYFEVLHPDNGAMGRINFLPLTYTPNKYQLISIYSKVLGWISQVLKVKAEEKWN